MSVKTPLKLNDTYLEGHILWPENLAYAKPHSEQHCFLANTQTKTVKSFKTFGAIQIKKIQ